MNKKTAEWLIPLCYFASEWHNGKGHSNKRLNDRVSYRMLCLAIRAAKRRGEFQPLSTPMTVKMKKVYQHLQDTYIPAEWRS